MSSSKALYFLRAFYNFTFFYSSASAGKVINEVVIDDGNTEEEINNSDAQAKAQRESLQLFFIDKINWILLAAFSSSLFVIVFYALFYPEKSVPEIIKNIFFTVLGWFGCAFLDFYKIQK